MRLLQGSILFVLLAAATPGMAAEPPPAAAGCHSTYGLVGVAVVVLALITAYVTMLNRKLAAEIVERKRVEAALRESVTRFEHLASCSADWIWETDANGIFTYSSPLVEQMLGYKSDEVIGKHQFEFFATAEKDRMRAVGRTTLGGGAPVFREQLRLITRDGRVSIQECTAEPILDGQGQLSGYRGVNRDVTSQVRFVQFRGAAQQDPS